MHSLYQANLSFIRGMALFTYDICEANILNLTWHNHIFDVLKGVTLSEYINRKILN